MKSAATSILAQIKDTDFILFKKADIRAFIEWEAEVLSEEELTSLFDDIYAFNAYLGRTEDSGFIEKVPFREYSVCLEWCESHMMIDDAFDLTLAKAKRFLGSLRRYYDYLIGLGKLTDSSQLYKAIKEVSGGRKLELIEVIPYTGSESYTSIGTSRRRSTSTSPTGGSSSCSIPGSTAPGRPCPRRPSAYRASGRRRSGVFGPGWGSSARRGSGTSSTVTS